MVTFGSDLHRLLILLGFLTISSWPPTIQAAEPVVISEFMAANTRTLRDDHGETSDWIEIHNRSSENISLAAYSLTDRSDRPGRWPFPDRSLPPNARLIVFASGRDQKAADKPLHTNFKLSSDGDYLALIGPDGRVVSSFTPTYPVQFPDVSYGNTTEGVSKPWYLPKPTPGQPNFPPGSHAGPILENATGVPSSQVPGSPLLLTIRATPSHGSLASVIAYYRVQFGTEKALPLNDSGTHGDALGADGIWSGLLPPQPHPPGTMLRWRFEAADTDNHTNRWPLNPHPQHSARYLGSVVQPESVKSALPVFHLFIPPPRLDDADTEEGTSATLFYDGEFYDNVLMKLRGNTTAGFPKKSHRLEFTPDHRFRYPGGTRRIRNTSLVAEWGDPTYLRQHLSFWLMAQAGTPAPFHDPVRVQLNGQFHQLALHSQVLGEELLERVGLDPRGALYKAVGTVTPDHNSTGGFEKKTRKHENEADYHAFSRALSSSSRGGSRESALFDQCDLPAVINYLAVARITQEDDDIWANMSLYRDSEGSGRWQPVAFDMNVSWGFSFASRGILANADDFRSHPFWGAAGIGHSQGHNRLYDAVIRTPATREMFLRRMRTLMDQFLQPPGTSPAQCVLETHLESLRQRMAPEAVMDRAQWGLSWNSSRGSTPARDLSLGIQAMVQHFIQPRRMHLYVTHAATNSSRALGIGADRNAGIPGPQPADCVVRLADVGRGDDRRQDWIRLTHSHPFAVDVSGWKLTGDVRFLFPPGTVIPKDGELFVAASHAGFQSRSTSPKTGEKRLVVGGFKGSLEKAHAIQVADATGRPVHSWKP